jgi:hypothetical protein
MFHLWLTRLGGSFEGGFGNLMFHLWLTRLGGSFEGGVWELDVPLVVNPFGWFI